MQQALAERLVVPEAKTAEAAEFDPVPPVHRVHDAAEHGIDDGFGVLLSEAGDAGHLLRERRVGTSISWSCPFHRGLEALLQVGSVAPAGGLEPARRGQSAPGAPPRRPSESLRPHSALRPAGGRRPLAQPSPLSGSVSPTAAGPVPQLDGLALAQVSLVNDPCPARPAACRRRCSSPVAPVHGSARGAVKQHSIRQWAVVPERCGVGNRQPTRERGAEARAGRPSMPRVRRLGRSREPPRLADGSGT